jgi:asparagine synthase (glutamine-hydrolysing)
MNVADSPPTRQSVLPAAQCLTGWTISTAGRTANAPKPPLASQSLNTRHPLFQSSGDAFGISSTAVIAEEANRLSCTIIGTPVWPSPALRHIAAELGQAAALSQAYVEYGSDLPKYLSGPFALVVHDQEKELTMLAIDRLGRLTLNYYADPHRLLWGSSVESVHKAADFELSLTPQGIYDYVYFHMVPAPSSLFNGLRKLQAGCMATYQSGEVIEQRYWAPTFRDANPANKESAYLQLKEVLSDSVKRSIPQSGRVGAFLSGGLDSSTVTGMLAEASEGTCDVYSIGFSAEGYDEMEYAQLTARHFGARLHEYYVTPDDVADALPMIASSYDEPFGNSSALPAYFCARLAREDGIDTLLAGDGGDELFAGNERYLKQKSFQAYEKTPVSLRHFLIEPVSKHLPDWFPLAQKIRSYIAQANVPLPDRLQTYNFLHQHDASEVFAGDFLSSVDTQQAIALQRNIYHTSKHASALNRMLFLDWQLTLADNDLRKVSQMCNLAGVEVAYPMLDDELVSFSTTIPDNWKLPGRELRGFYKRALTGWLPAETIAKPKQGFGLPFGVWMRDNKRLQEIAHENLSKLNERKIFNPKFISDVIDLHRSAHPSYYGELVWILVVLEYWLGTHADKTAEIAR